MAHLPLSSLISRNFTSNIKLLASQPIFEVIAERIDCAETVFSGITLFIVESTIMLRLLWSRPGIDRLKKVSYGWLGFFRGNNPDGPADVPATFIQGRGIDHALDWLKEPVGDSSILWALLFDGSVISDSPQHLYRPNARSVKVPSTGNSTFLVISSSR